MEKNEFRVETIKVNILFPLSYKLDWRGTKKINPLRRYERKR